MIYDVKNFLYDEIFFYFCFYNKKFILSHCVILRIEIKKFDNLNLYWYGNRFFFDKY